MNKAEAKISSEKINTSVVLLEGNEVIDLFTIDISDLLVKAKLSYNADNPYFQNKKSTEILSAEQFKFRFHNSVKNFTGNTSVSFVGKQYLALPIQAEGFEYATRGSPPTPTLSLAVRGDGNVEVEKSFRMLKLFLRDFDDLSGAKVTRIRTFVKHLDLSTWCVENNSLEVPHDKNYPKPSNHDPDPNATISIEVFYIDRKSVEDQSNLRFELSNLFDLQEVKIPNRMVMEKICSWQYRGEGCCYEYKSRKIDEEHGAKTTLPTYAPPVADDRNNKFESLPVLSGKTLKDQGLWTSGVTYQIANVVHVEVDSIKYYFVAIRENKDIPPPNVEYWVQDQCSKTIKGCSLRWGQNGQATKLNNPPFINYPNIRLRFSGFPGLMKRGGV